MSAKKQSAIPAGKLELYDRLIAAIPAIQPRGAANPYTSHNGHMFTYLDATGSMALRLAKDDREKFLVKYQTTLFEAYGAVMKEFVKVPEELLADTAKMKKYLELSFAHTQTLKPKPTAKSKPVQKS